MFVIFSCNGKPACGWQASFYNYGQKRYHPVYSPFIDSCRRHIFWEKKLMSRV